MMQSKMKNNVIIQLYSLGTDIGESFTFVSHYIYSNGEVVSLILLAISEGNFYIKVLLKNFDALGNSLKSNKRFCSN